MNGTELAIQIMQLQSDARRLMRDHHFQPGHLHRIPDAEGYRLAFGYLVRSKSGVLRQRYFEIPVSNADYTAMNESVRHRILESLAERMQGISCV